MFVNGMCLMGNGDGSMKDYREFSENERESIDDICIEIHKRRLLRNGICVSMHKYDNSGLWCKFDSDPYHAFPKTLERAIEAFVKEIPVERIDINYDDGFPDWSDQDIFGLVEEIQEYENDLILYNVMDIIYYLDIGNLETVKIT